MAVAGVGRGEAGDWREGTWGEGLLLADTGWLILEGEPSGAVVQDVMVRQVYQNLLQRIISK